MRLCDALRQTISEYGSGAVSGESLPELLSQRGAFDGCPGLRDAVNAFAALGLGRELSLLSHDDRSGLLSFVSRTSEALVAKGGIREDLARYTAARLPSGFLTGSRRSLRLMANLWITGAGMGHRKLAQPEIPPACTAW